VVLPWRLLNLHSINLHIWNRNVTEDKKIIFGKLSAALLLWLLVTVAVLWFLHFCFGIYLIDPVNFVIGASDFKFSWQLVVPFTVSGGIAVWAAVRRSNSGKIFATAKALLPLLLLIPAMIFPESFLLASFSLAALIWTAWRVCAVLQFKLPEISVKRGWFFVVTAAVTGCIYGIWMQYDSWYRCILGCSDWSVYAEFYRDLYGKNITAYLSTGGHFNLLPNMLFMPLFGMMKMTPDKLFIINSLFIYSVIPATFYTMRCHGIKPFGAMLFAISLLFHFTLANLNMSFFYGYHPSVMFPLLFLLFDAAMAEKRYKTALVFAVLTLLIQETFAVFWFGYGMMMFITERGKRRIAGAIYAVTMVIWFFIVTGLFMSFAPDRADGYQQMFHYAHLGNTVGEILLSPVLKPAAFWGDLAGENNFTFALLLSAAFLPVMVWDVRRILAAIPVLAGVWLLKGDTLNNVVMQYQTELFALLIAVSADGLAAYQNKTASRADRLFGCGISFEKNNIAPPLYAFTAGCLLCGAFAGRLPWGHFSYGNVMEMSPRSEREIGRLYEVIPPGSSIQSTAGILAHFIGRNKLIDFTGGISAEAEYIIIPNNDVLSTPDWRRTLMEKMIKISGAKVMLVNENEGNEIFCFRMPEKKNGHNNLEKSAL